MNEAGCGCAAVLCDGRLVGVITVQDIVRTVVGMTADPAQVAVESIMIRNPVCTDPEVSVTHAIYRMKELELECLPVIDSQHVPLGIFTLRDAFPSELMEAGVLVNARNSVNDGKD